ncbi:hypothetical protein ACF0H5_009972 [Mactra antiquata]
MENAVDRPHIRGYRFPGPFNPYPEGYKPRVHGPYDPSRYYGKTPKVSLWDVKLGSLLETVLSADYRKRNLLQTVSRFFARYHARHWRVKNRTFAPLLQVIFVGHLFYFVGNANWDPENTGSRTCTARYKYH